MLLGGAEPPFVMAAGPGSVASLHTNPIAIGVPADGPSMILDMATSLVAEGKVAIAALTRHDLSPRARSSSRGGDITTDPAEFYEGRAPPVRRPQGFRPRGDGRGALRQPHRRGRREPCPAEGALVICVNAGGFRPEGEVRASVEELRAACMLRAGSASSSRPASRRRCARDRARRFSSRRAARQPASARGPSQLMQGQWSDHGPRECLGLAGLPSFSTSAVRSGGGSVVTLEQANAIVCTGDDVELLRRSILPGIRWVQLGAAGVEMWFDAGLMTPDVVWTAAKGVYARPMAEHILA